MAESSYMIAPGERDAFLRRKMAAELYQKNVQPQKIDHWTQGLAQLLNAGISGYEMHSLDKQEKEEAARGNELMAKLLTGGQPSAAPANPAMTPPMGNQVAAALSAGPTQPPQPGNRPEVMPTAKVWGDKEAEAAGLYDPSPKPAQMAQVGPQAALPPPAPMPAQTVNGGTAAPGFTPQPGLNRDALIAMLQNRNTAPMARGLIQQQIAQQLSPKTTDEIREFEYATKNPAFKDYKTDLKRAGAIQNQVVIDQKGETAFNTEAGKVQAKRFDEIAGEGPKAKQMVSDVETLRMLGDQIRTGKMAEVKAAIGPYADAVGAKIDGLNEIQAFEAVVNRVAPNMRVPGSGAQSDYELRNFLKSMPTLGNTPEGNALIAKTMEGVYQNKISAAEIASRALNGDIKRPEAEKMLRELPDPMKDWREAQKAMKKPAGGQPSIDDLVKKYSK
jgi:hypothetical protein